MTKKLDHFLLLIPFFMHSFFPIAHLFMVKQKINFIDLKIKVKRKTKYAIKVTTTTANYLINLNN